MNGRVLVLGALLAAAGCGRSCSDDEKKADAKAAIDAGDARVEILSEGRAPRALLQVARWKGLSYRMVVENDASIGEPGQIPLRPPILVSTLRVEVSRGSARPVVREVNGRKLRLIEERAVIEKVEVKPGQLSNEAIARANQELTRFAGTSTRQLVSDDGEIVEMTTELVGGAPPAPDVKRALDEVWDMQRRFPFRLPRRPVGVGARWRFAEPIEQNGVRAMQMADMQIAEMDESRVKIRIRLRHQAPRQEIPHPLDPNDSAMLERYRGDGDGELLMDRLSAVLLSARLSTTANLEVSAHLGGEPISKRFIAATRVVTSGEVLSSDAGAMDDAGKPP